MNRAAQTICAWCGPAFVVGFCLAFAVLGGFVPPPAPTSSPATIAAFFRDDTTRVQLGLFLAIFAIMPMILWGVGLARLCGRGGEGSQLFGTAQLICVAIGAAAGVVDMTIWALAAFRSSVDADTLRTINDLGWLFFEFTTPPFCLWAISVGLAILFDERPVPVFPRWAGYLSLWAALCFAPTDLVIFFKTGPFAWNGLLAFYAPLTIFFAWLLTMHVLILRAIRSPIGDAEGQPAADDRRHAVLTPDPRAVG